MLKFDCWSLAKPHQHMIVHGQHLMWIIVGIGDIFPWQIHGRHNWALLCIVVPCGKFWGWHGHSIRCAGMVVLTWRICFASCVWMVWPFYKLCHGWRNHSTSCAMNDVAISQVMHRHYGWHQTIPQVVYASRILLNFRIGAYIANTFTCMLGWDEIFGSYFKV